MIATKKAKYSLYCLPVSNVRSSRMIKMAQLRLRLDDQLTKRRHPYINIKLKTVTKLSYLTGRIWWMAIDSDNLLAKKNPSKREYYQIRKKS